MSFHDTFTVGGIALDVTLDDYLPIRYSERLGAIPTLTIQRRGIALPGTPDPWIGQAITWQNNSTGSNVTYFSGDVLSVSPSFDQRIGWILTYQCYGLRNRLDWFAHTDSNTGLQMSAYNLLLTDPNYNPVRAGRTVGQILTDVLTMNANANTIAGYGIGNYTGLPLTPTLPAVTVADLALMTVVIPHAVYFSGEKFGAALDGLLSEWAPNHRFWIDHSGNMRILDTRTFTPTTYTMGVDPIEPVPVSRDISNCFERVVVRGQPIAVMALLKLSRGDITEFFAHDGLSNTAAKAAWTPAQFKQPGTAQDIGTLTCTSTITLVLTSSNPATNWTAGFWDQSHQQGTINISSTTVVDFTQYWSARVVSCTALTPGGTCTITIDNPLPTTNYDHYTLTGLSTGASVVWTRYQITNTQLWARITNQSTYPQPFIFANGQAATLTSSPMAAVFDAQGDMFPLPFTWNSTLGTINFVAPTFNFANGAPPTDVWVMLPIQTNPNNAIEPPNISGVPQFAGTSFTVDGQAHTLLLDASQWLDPGQLTQVQAYASDVLDSVKNAVCEAGLVWYGFNAELLNFGMSVNIAGKVGTTFTTGWESLALPVIGCEIEWPQSEGQDYVTTGSLSNRRDSTNAEIFMKPPRSWLPIGGNVDVFQGTLGAAPTTSYAGNLMESQGNAEQFNKSASDGSLASMMSSPTAGGMNSQAPDFSGGLGMSDALAAGMDTGSGIQDRQSQAAQKQSDNYDARQDAQGQKVADRRASDKAVDRQIAQERQGDLGVAAQAMASNVNLSKGSDVASAKDVRRKRAEARRAKLGHPDDNSTLEAGG